MPLPSFSLPKNHPTCPSARATVAGITLSLLLAVAAPPAVVSRLVGERETPGSMVAARQLGKRDPPGTCKGDSRDDGNDDLLEKDEAICDDDDKDIRFGLNDLGYLGLWDGNDVTWWAGAKGDRLVLQTGDANLVVYDDDDDEWATNCKARNGAKGKRFSIKNGAVTVIDSKNKVVWELDEDGDESKCYPDDSSSDRKDPPETCKGDSRAAGNAKLLEKNEAICDEDDNDIRFGLNDRGYLGLWDGDDVTWWAGERGDRLVLQVSDANLVLYKGDDDEWASDCKAKSGRDGKKFYIKDGAVRVKDTEDDTVWKLDDDGDESDCYP